MYGIHTDSYDATQKRFADIDFKDAKNIVNNLVYDPRLREGVEKLIGELPAQIFTSQIDALHAPTRSTTGASWLEKIGAGRGGATSRPLP